MSNNNASAVNNGDFVSETIEELLRSNRIIGYAKQDLHVINPLSVSVQSSGKKRLILDLRYVNQYILKKKVKFEDYRKALEYFCLGGYAFKFDMKSGYHRIDIFLEHQKFLGFSWTFPDGLIRYFAYTVLPFGLSSAPYIFTKVVRPLVKYWRAKGFYCVVYLDDGLCIERSLHNAKITSPQVQNDLLAAGFIVNQEKSIWIPVQNIEWLGILWDFHNGVISIPDRRIEKILKL